MDMFQVAIKKVLSVAISALLIYVPKDKVEREMASIPTIEQRAAGSNLKGWSLEKAASERTGITHYYYHLPSSADNAPRLVCIHGFNTDGRVFLNLNVLADRFELIAYNLPEESPYYTGTMADFITILDDFMETLDIDTVVIVGNSIGGGIALHYCASKPGVGVTALILLSTSVFGATPEDKQRYRGMADKLLPYEDYQLFYLLQKGQAIVGRFERTDLGNDAPADAIVTKRIGWYRQVLQALYNYDGRTDAQGVTCPVLALHGTADRVITPTAASTIPRYISTARLVRLDGVGHSMVFSNADIVARNITEFVSTALQPGPDVARAR